MDIYVSKPNSLLDAIRYGSTVFVDSMLEKGEDPNSLTEEGVPVLWSAVMENNPEIVRLLCENSASVSWQNEQGMNAIMLAAIKNKAAVAQVLLPFVKDFHTIDNQGNSLIHYLAFGGNVDLFSELQKRAGWLTDFYTLENGESKSALMIAAEEGHVAIVEKLLSVSKSHPKAHLQKSLCAASMAGNSKVVTALYKAGANLTEKDDTGKAAIHYACLTGKKETIAEMITLLPEIVHCSDLWRNTPLHYAAATQNEELFDFLIANNANEKLKNNDNLTAHELLSS